MDLQQRYTQISIKTGEILKATLQSLKAGELSRLSLPEIETMVDQIAQMVPAGNVPGMILSGLARLPGRKLPRPAVKPGCKNRIGRYSAPDRLTGEIL